MERVPAVFIIDDPPVNSAYLMRKQMEAAGKPLGEKDFFTRTYLLRWREMEKSAIIPNAFFKKLAGWAVTEGVKGKCTLLACPGGLGFLDDKVAGYSGEQLKELLDIFRNDITRNFDITPEILTHTLALALKTNQLLPQTEHEWMALQNEETLTDYMAKGLQVLKNAGITATGITQPCNYRGDFGLYSRAVLAAEKRVNKLGETYYFHDCNSEDKKVSSKIMLQDPEKNEYVVSIVSASRADEPFWYTLYGEGDPEKLADYYISKDGKSGRFIDLLSTNSPLVFHAHGQTLYSNGSEKGFLSLQVVIARMKKYLSGRISWMKIGEFADWNIKQQEKHEKQ